MKLDVKSLVMKMAKGKAEKAGKARGVKYDDDGSYERFIKGIYEDTFPDREDTVNLVDSKGLAKSMARKLKKRKSEDYY